MNKFKIFIGFFVILFYVSCSSGRAMISPKLPEKYEKLSAVEGSACGYLLFGPPYLAFIPIGLNDRFQEAYNEALKKVPGAIGLMNVSIEEKWANYYITHTSKCVTIKGDAYK